MSAPRPYKATERAVARILGGVRHGHLGGADVLAGDLVVEVKHRRTIPAWLLAALDQATQAAGSGQLPVAVLHQHGGRHDGDLVIMSMATFKALTGGRNV